MDDRYIFTSDGERRPETMLALDEVRKYYAGPGGVVKAVDGASVSVDEGDLLAIYGPSGSGKTTLLLLAAGLLRADRGNVTFDGTDLSTFGEKEAVNYRRNELGFIFQMFNLVPALSALYNVALPMMFGGVGHKEASEEAAEMLKLVGLEKRAGHRPAQLSGGERQRVAIARALAGSPRLILADEPTGNLDTKMGDEVLSLLSGLCRDRRVAVVLVTHDLRAAGYADQIRSMHDGKLSTDHRPAEELLAELTRSAV